MKENYINASTTATNTRKVRCSFGNPVQYSWLENLMDRGAWGAIVQRVARVVHDLMTEHAHTTYKR